MAVLRCKRLRLSVTRYHWFRIEKNRDIKKRLNIHANMSIRNVYYPILFESDSSYNYWAMLWSKKSNIMQAIFGHRNSRIFAAKDWKRPISITSSNLFHLVFFTHKLSGHD